MKTTQVVVTVTDVAGEFLDRVVVDVEQKRHLAVIPTDSAFPTKRDWVNNANEQNLDISRRP